MRHLLFSALIFAAHLLAGDSFAESSEVRVGVISALTGGMATIGTAVKNGIELAREDRPELFGGISFIYEDDQFDAKQSINAYRRLNETKPSCILGFGTVLAQAIGPLVERDRIPLINFNFEAEPAAGKKFIIRSFNHTRQYMGALGSYLRKTGHKEFPVIRTEATFLNAMTSNLREALSPEAALTEIAVVTPGANNFRPFIGKVRGSRHVGLFMWPEELLLFFQQARELNFEADYFGTDLCETAAALSPGSGLAERCVYPDNDASPQFRERYRLKYGNEAQLTFAGGAYDMTLLLGELIRGGSGASPEALLAGLASTSERPGVLGKFSYREEPGAGRYFEYPIRIKRITGGRGIAADEDTHTEDY